MARVPMVTRTIITTEADVLCMNIANGEPFRQVVALPRTYKDDAHVLKQVRKVIDNDTIKAVHVVETREVETLYGMSEQQFIELAEKLPPRAKQESEAEDKEEK